MKKFKDKVVLITGASRGIGKATALAFAKEGAKVVIDYFISDIEPDAELNAKNVVKEIESMEQKAIMFQADIRDEIQVKNLINETIKTFGKIDILINNAGVVFDENYENKTVEHWTQTLNTNLVGQFLMIKNAVPFLPEGAKIINISSSNATTCFSTDAIDYDASKAGIMVMTKDFAQILAPKKIFVNAILPCWVNTDMNKNLPLDFVKEETEKIWLKRFAEPEEISKLILFLASDDNTYITGSLITIDGGHV